MLQNIRWRYLIILTVKALILTIGMFLTVYLFIPSLIEKTIIGVDWLGTFRPAILSGKPYDNAGFFSPPWVVVLLAPFAFLPKGISTIVIMAASVAVWIIVMRRLKASWFLVFAMLMTPQLWFGILMGNIDFLIPLGLILPPPIGLFFVLAKPQVGIGIAVYWIVVSFLQGGWRRTLVTVAPIGIVSLLFFIPFGFWPIQLLRAVNLSWNISPFPYLVGAGILLLIRAIKTRRIGLAVMSSPFLAPYVSAQSVPTAALGFLPSETETIIVILSIWAAWILRGFL